MHNDEQTQWFDPKAIELPPWPHGAFKINTLYDEAGCQYLNDGNGAGILQCPSMGEGKSVGCKGDVEKMERLAVTTCNVLSKEYALKVHRVVVCEW